jgi:hypothetical protein
VGSWGAAAQRFREARRFQSFANERGGDLHVAPLTFLSPTSLPTRCVRRELDSLFPDPGMANLHNTCPGALPRSDLTLPGNGRVAA